MKVHIIPTALTVAITACIGLLAGIQIERAETKWSNVVVVLDNTVVTDPDTLTPEKLAAAHILDRRARLICVDRPAIGMRFEEDQFGGCREIRRL